MTAPTLAKITTDNVRTACDLAVEPHQATYVAPVVRSLAEAYAQPDVACAAPESGAGDRPRRTTRRRDRPLTLGSARVGSA